MVRVEISYRDDVGNNAWLDITQSLAKQFSAGLPSGFGKEDYGIYPDKTAKDHEPGHWYDLRMCIYDAVQDAKAQLEIAKQNTSSNSSGANNVELAEKKLASLKNFFDGRAHAIKVTDTESKTNSNLGVNIRVLMEYRYTSRNA